jgi:hypothetical protein
MLIRQGMSCLAKCLSEIAQPVLLSSELVFQLKTTEEPIRRRISIASSLWSCLGPSQKMTGYAFEKI